MSFVKSPRSHLPLCSLLLVSCGVLFPADPPAYDLLFAGGRVVDGTGAPWFRADVAVTGDRIAAVGDLSGAAAKRRIDARGLVVAPGFIDMLGQSEYHLLVDNRAASKITQGITTEITGEGSSIAPLNERMIADGRETWERYGLKPDWTTLEGYFRALERARPALNLGTFVGAGGVRDLVIGQADRPATPEELRAMEEAVARAMEDGAFGLSTSLQYVPDRFASTEEIIALARVAARHGGTYLTHQRSESNRIAESLDEVFRIARDSTSLSLPPSRAGGLDVSADQYPYTAASNGLDACLPLWAREGGKDRLVERLKDARLRERIRAEVLREDPAFENQYLGSGGPAGVLVSTVLNADLKKYEGMNLEEIGRAEKKDPLDALMDLVIADRASSYCITSIMNEDDVRAALRHPLVSMCTDSPAVAEDGIYSQQKSHPRAWGSAARILGKYVREERLLSLEEAVRKMTSLPAGRMGLADRGILRPGLAADLVAFDPEKVQDLSTYAEPRRYSAGIPYVAVNGELVVDGGKITAARPGRILRGPGWKKGR